MAEKIIISKQFVDKVVNFSTQYGKYKTEAYTAVNLVGGPRVKKYGDYVEAFMLRTYGTWWKICPSGIRKVCKVAHNFISEDFIELQFKDAVIPTSITIYESYNPGTVVRILACNATSKSSAPGQVEWVTLWSGHPQISQVPKAMRQFTPPLKQIFFPTRYIRLEFNSDECEYYTALDAVELTGMVPNDSMMQPDRALGFKIDITTRLLHDTSLSDRQASILSQDGGDEFDKWSVWAMLPDELIQNIFSYLDVVSLCNIAQTCTLLLKNAYDPFVFSNLDLQSRWNTVDNVALESLKARCSHLQRLNLSWTGGGLITEDAFCNFLKECGRELKMLHLASCPYIGEQAMITIGKVCRQLEDFDIQSCKQLDGDALVNLAEMTTLKRLNMYGLTFYQDVINAIGRCVNAEHLNIGGCHIKERTYTRRPFTEGSISTIVIMQNIPLLTKLISLDLWRTKEADIALIIAIAKSCPNLEELEIGWCPATISNKDFPAEILCSKCPKLRKLFMSSGRYLSDAHMLSIANHCKGMEQLDILGAMKVTDSGIDIVCTECPRLYFFDVSFCTNISIEIAADLQSKYPHICFKKASK